MKEEDNIQPGQMRVSIILGHPYQHSYNKAIAHAVVDTVEANGHIACFHDLYGEGFNPVISAEELASDISNDPLVTAHQQEIKQADGIVIIHPNWWGQPPAILKGWVDRVLREKIAYTFSNGDSGGGLPIGLLKAKVGLVFNTSNTSTEREESVFGDPLKRLWRDCIFDFCGVKTFDRMMLRVVADSSLSEREKWLADIKNMIGDYFPPISGKNG
ncbi:MAG: NAD(P)H-dependent oxidoreductase [Tannerella sp.]|jgi:putative NADPH-quinone reductase|nr:NAD(P)H-dependent oxidoreductase [Tannerella sp.]